MTKNEDRMNAIELKVGKARFETIRILLAEELADLLQVMLEERCNEMNANEEGEKTRRAILSVAIERLRAI